MVFICLNHPSLHRTKTECFMKFYFRHLVDFTSTAPVQLSEALVPCLGFRFSCWRLSHSFFFPFKKNQLGCHQLVTSFLFLLLPMSQPLSPPNQLFANRMVASLKKIYDSYEEMKTVFGNSTYQESLQSGARLSVRCYFIFTGLSYHNLIASDHEV